MATQKNMIAQFKDEVDLLRALTKMQEEKVSLVDIYGPFANHDILKKFTKESRMPYLAVLYGLGSMTGIFALMYFITVIDYPINYGGKPYFSFPPMVVIMFLFTILGTTILSVLTFHALAKIFPGKQAKIIDPSQTDDKFFMVINKNNNTENIENWLREYGAEDVFEKDLNEA